MDAVRQLSLAEKLKLNEMIWKDDMTIPHEHQKLVKNRKSKSDTNPHLLLDWETASKKLVS